MLCGTAAAGRASWVAARRRLRRGVPAPTRQAASQRRLSSSLAPDRAALPLRARFLNRIKEAYDQDAELATLIAAPYFRDAVEAGIDSWRRVVVKATELGIPVPGFASALSYYDALRTERLPAALTQGLRDFFGAHTYGRTDADPAARFHTLWSGDRTEVEA